MSDLIRREDVRAFIKKWGDILTADALAELVDNLPSADITQTEECQECQAATNRILCKMYRPHGEWRNNRNGTFTCDQCGCKHSKSNYCPNCGADMRGE